MTATAQLAFVNLLVGFALSGLAPAVYLTDPCPAAAASDMLGTVFFGGLLNVAAGFRLRRHS